VHFYSHTTIERSGVCEKEIRAIKMPSVALISYLYKFLIKLNFGSLPQLFDKEKKK